MFRLSDAGRRVVTTGLFVLLCVVPTVVVIALGLWRCLPGRVTTEQRRLSLLLGQPVRLESVRHLRPGSALYEGLEVLDPESGAVLLRCDWLCTRLDSVRPKDAKTSYRQLRLSAREIKVTATSPEALRPLADRLLQRRIAGAPRSAVLSAKQLVLKSNDHEFRIQQSGAWLTLQPQESRVEVNLRLDGQAKPIYLNLTRRRNIEPPIDEFKFGTGDDAISCSLLSTLMPPFPELGANAQFQGWIVGSHTAQGWYVRAKADLREIELLKLVGEHLPYEVSGTGSLLLEQLEVRAGRIASMKGVLRAENGRISRQLVASCARELGLTTTFPTSGSTALLPFQELAAGFHLDGSGLRLSGKCSAGAEGALLVGGYTQRLDGPSETSPPIHPAKAIAAITSTPEGELSTSRHAARLMQRLPFISTAATATIADPRTSYGPQHGRH